jgi:SpoVK/Ycf46/Vps4 family AAA+-type ATPase
VKRATQIGLLGEETHGFVGADLASLCSEAAISALRRRVLDSFSTFSTTWEDFATAKRSVRPSALRELAVDIPKVRWVDIGGNDDLKHQLREVVEWPVRCQSSLDRMGVKPPRGECHRVVKRTIYFYSSILSPSRMAVVCLY